MSTWHTYKKNAERLHELTSSLVAATARGAAAYDFITIGGPVDSVRVTVPLEAGQIYADLPLTMLTDAAHRQIRYVVEEKLKLEIESVQELLVALTEAMAKFNAQPTEEAVPFEAPDA